ncbi:lipoprotein [Inquilinus limosus]|uniref:lipoprotein n=1 Tax=Inquilinus limosus TaxID=171674 RepID=UPI000479D75D
MKRMLLAALSALLLAGCAQGIPKEALQLSQESLQQRQLQTRRFDSADEGKLLQASAGVLQDLGFTIDQSDTTVGVIAASKNRDATETGQVVGAVLLAALTGVPQAFDKDQKIKASLVTRPIGDGKSTAVRVTFQRYVWNTRGQVSKIEGLNDPQLYKEFFDKLSQSVFLTANEI